MTFKEALSADNDNVFINPDEFGELHKVNGTDTAIVIDEDGLEELESLQSITSDGLYTAKMILYIKAADFGNRPAVGVRIKIDTNSYLVLNVLENTGLYKIILGVKRA